MKNFFWLRNRPPKLKYHFFRGLFSCLTYQSQAGTLSTVGTQHTVGGTYGGALYARVAQLSKIIEWVERVKGHFFSDLFISHQVCIFNW